MLYPCKPVSDTYLSIYLTNYLSMWLVRLPLIGFMNQTAFPNITIVDHAHPTN